MTAVYVAIYVRKDNMVVARASAVVVRVNPIVRLQAFSFWLDHQVLLLINVCDSLVVFGLFIQLGCKS